MPMLTYIVELEVYISVYKLLYDLSVCMGNNPQALAIIIFIYIHTLCMPASMSMERLCGCTAFAVFNVNTISTELSAMLVDSMQNN